MLSVTHFRHFLSSETSSHDVYLLSSPNTAKSDWCMWNVTHDTKWFDMWPKNHNSHLIILNHFYYYYSIYYTLPWGQIIHDNNIANHSYAEYTLLGSFTKSLGFCHFFALPHWIGGWKDRGCHCDADCKAYRVHAWHYLMLYWVGFIWFKLINKFIWLWFNSVRLIHLMLSAM